MVSRNFCQKYVRVNSYTHCENYGILLPRFILQKFRQINVLLKNFTINWFDGKKFAWPKCSPQYIFGKNFVKITYLLKSWFDVKKFQWQCIFFIFPHCSGSLILVFPHSVYVNDSFRNPNFIFLWIPSPSSCKNIAKWKTQSVWNCQNPKIINYVRRKVWMAQKFLKISTPWVCHHLNKM